MSALVDSLRHSAFARKALFSLVDAYGAVMPIPNAYCILMYHRVVSDETRSRIAPGLRVDVERFRTQMTRIKQLGEVLPLAEMVRRIEQRIQPERPCFAVTFDDGYADNLEAAYPVMKEMNIPATLFVATGFIDDRSLTPWWDSLYDTLGEELQGQGDAAAVFARRANEAKEGGIAAMTGAAGQNSFLEWPALLRIMEEGLLTVGAHTVTHPVLSRCADSGRDEIANGLRRLEEVTSTKIDLFAYPFGKSSDFNTGTVTHVKDLGFGAAFTTEYGINRPGADIYRLARIPVAGNESEARFLARIKAANLMGRLL